MHFYFAAAFAIGIAAGACTEVAGLRPGFPFGASSLLRLIRNGWVGFASFDVSMYFRKSLSLANTYSSALFTTSSAATLVNAAYWLTRFAVDSSSETVVVTFRLLVISSNGMDVLPVHSGWNNWLDCCSFELRFNIEDGVVEEYFGGAVISSYRDNFADLPACCKSSHLDDYLNCLRYLRRYVVAIRLLMRTHRQFAEPAECFHRRAGVNRCHRTCVTGIERIEQRAGLFAAHLAKDDSVGPPPQRGLQ